MTRNRTFSFDDWDEFQKQQDWHDQAHRRLDSIVMKPVEWLWPGFIPRGMVTILTGEEGLGKSQLAYRIAAEFSRDEKWGGKNPQDDAPGGLVKLYSAEDPEAQVLVPRVRANGANMAHVYTEGIDSDTFLSDAGIESIAKGLDEFGFGLIVIDPIIAYFTAKQDTNAAQDVRAVMRKFSALAEQSNAVFILITHPKKGEETQTLHKMIGGSAAFGQAARSVLCVAQHPDEDDQRVLGRLKGNLGRPPTPFIYEIVGTTVHEGKVALPTSRVNWIGDVPEEFDFNAAVLRRPQPTSRDEMEDDGSAGTEAKRFLFAELEEGELPVKEILSRARAAAISPGTLYRAKALLGVKAARHDGGWYWMMERDDE